MPAGPKKRKAGSVKSSLPLIQGEGDYVSGKRYQKAAHRFAQEHDTESLARAAAPRDDSEQQELIEAERKGKAKARGGKSPRR